MYAQSFASRMSPLVQSLIATAFVSALSLLGIIFIFREWTERLSVVTLSFAAGVLLATAFLELLPEAVDLGAGGNVFPPTLGAIIGFFVLERVISGFHVHEEGRSPLMTSRYLILVGDALHNFIDGVAIGASFLANPALGIVTTLAITAHEVPKEIADYGILISGGFAPRTALLLNFLTALTAVAGALVCFLVKGFVQSHLAGFMAATAGTFIYIAGSDLIPELHHPRHASTWMATVPFIIGVVLMAVVGFLVPESH
jgi:zinc and cadmium transporter